MQAFALHCLRMQAVPRPNSTFKFGSAAEPLQRSETVLLLVDFINPLQFEAANQIADAAVVAARRTSRLKAKLAGRGVQTVYANDNYGIWRSEFRDLLAYCREVGGAAGELAELLAPDENDFTVLKPRHSAFFATPLDLLLQQMHTRELIVVGLATDICVQVTAMDAYLRGFGIKVPASCTAAETDERKHGALTQMRNVFNVDTAELMP